MGIFRKYGRRSKTSVVAFTSGIFLALVLLGVSGVWGVRTASASAQDCDNNAIIYCGFNSASDFITKVKANDSGNSAHQHDLQTIYAAYGLEPASYDKFVTSARQGTAYKDGHIVVDGQTVATGAKSIGRQVAGHGSDYFTQKIGSTNYYGNATQKTFAADSIPVTVMFDANGIMQFAVLNSCGNPLGTTPVKPSYSCNALQKTPVAGKANTYQFTTSASAANNASIAKVVYDFGDGATATETNPATPVTHAYTASGTYTAKVTVYVKLPGNQQVTAVSANCQTVIQVQIPYYQCAQLSGAILDKDKMTISFTATARYGGGATFTGADFDFGDGVKQKGAKPASGASSVTTTHIYKVANTYSAKVVLHFSVNGQDVVAAACLAKVTPTQPPTPECKPGIPVGSPECTPCQYDSSLPSNSPQCVPVAPPSLPNTGAGDTIAIFAGLVVAGFMVYRQLLFRKHHAAFAAAEHGTSPLPLGDPLNVDAPLQNVQFTRKRPSLRRHRLR